MLPASQNKKEKRCHEDSLQAFAFCFFQQQLPGRQIRLGTWTADMVKFRQQVKNLPPGAVGDTFKVEAYKDGYKLTQTAGKAPHTYTFVTSVDFKAGVTAVRDGQGQEIDRVKVVRISSTEIETTSMNTGVTFNYHIVQGGSEIEVKISNRKDGKPPLTAYYKRVP